jgi:hypothetical protein
MMSLPSSWAIVVGISALDDINNRLYFFVRDAPSYNTTMIVTASLTSNGGSYSAVTLPSLSTPLIGVHYSNSTNMLYVVRTDGLYTLNAATGSAAHPLFDCSS